MDYGQDYDFSKNFFEQLGNLFKKIPRRALYQDFDRNPSDSIYRKQNNHCNKLCIRFREHTLKSQFFCKNHNLAYTKIFHYENSSFLSFGTLDTRWVAEHLFFYKTRNLQTLL